MNQPVPGFYDFSAQAKAQLPVTAGEAKNVTCVVVIADHRAFDYKRLVAEAPLIVDTRNALKRFTSSKIVR